MSILFAIFLGLIQGLTEFLPVSSSGHLSILQNFFGMSDIEQSHMLFDVMLHLGTLISVFIVFRKDIAAIIKELLAICGDIFKSKKQEIQEKAEKPKPARHLILMIIVATLPLFAILPINDYVEQLYYKTWFIGLALILTGCLLYISDKVVTGNKNEKNATMLNALFIGCIQAVAVIPGISRSGSTITAGLFCGCKRDFAVKFSFLLSIPAILGANILSIGDALKAGIDASLLPAYLLGTIVAAAAGCGAIKLVKLLTDKGKFGKFAYYCWAVGLITVIASILI
jgi:undecaprenyl-diphosphatase